MDPFLQLPSKRLRDVERLLDLFLQYVDEKRTVDTKNQYSSSNTEQHMAAQPTDVSLLQKALEMRMCAAKLNTKVAFENISTLPKTKIRTLPELHGPVIIKSTVPSCKELQSVASEEMDAFNAMDLHTKIEHFESMLRECIIAPSSSSSAPESALLATLLFCIKVWETLVQMQTLDNQSVCVDDPEKMQPHLEPKKCYGIMDWLTWKLEFFLLNLFSTESISSHPFAKQTSNCAAECIAPLPLSMTQSLLFYPVSFTDDELESDPVCSPASGDDNPDDNVFNVPASVCVPHETLEEHLQRFLRLEQKHERESCDASETVMGKGFQEHLKEEFKVAPELRTGAPPPFSSLKESAKTSAVQESGDSPARLSAAVSVWEPRRETQLHLQSLLTPNWVPVWSDTLEREVQQTTVKEVQAVQRSLQHLRDLTAEMAAQAEAEMERIQETADSLEETCTSTRQVARELAQASKQRTKWWGVKTSVPGMIGGTLLTVGLGPIGLVAGATLGGAVGLAAGNSARRHHTRKMNRILNRLQSPSR